MTYELWKLWKLCHSNNVVVIFLPRYTTPLFGVLCLVKRTVTRN